MKVVNEDFDNFDSNIDKKTDSCWSCGIECMSSSVFMKYMITFVQ